MGKTSKSSSKNNGDVKFSERAMRGISQLRPLKVREGKGMSISTFQRMVRSSKIGLPVWSGALHLSPSTLEQRIERKASFDPLEADRLLTVEQVLKRGMEVFEDSEDLMLWLQRKHRLLQNQRPMDLLGSTPGIGLVMMELGRIEHGVY